MSRPLSFPPRRFAPLLLVLALAPLAGCDTEGEPEVNERAFPGVTIKVAAVGDPAALEAVKAWRPTWERETGAKVQFLDGAVTPGELKGADVILYPGQTLGELVDRRDLAGLNDSAVRPPIPLGSGALPPDPLAYNDIAPAFREQVSKYGEERMGLPLGGSGLVIVYRRDAFESEANRAAARAKGLSLVPPGGRNDLVRTWEDLDVLAKFFAGRDWDGDGQPEAGISVALGNDPEGVGDAVVLARATSLGQHPDHYGLLFDPETLEPRIATPPFVEALAAVAAWKPSAPEKAEAFDAEAARAAFRNGEAALLIDRAEMASRWTDPKKPAAVGVAPLPASPKVYDPDRKAWQDAPSLNRVVYLPRGGGWLAGMSPSSSGPTRKAALDFVRSLAGPETSRLLVADPALPMLPTRNAQLGSGLPNPRAALGVDPASWGIAVARTVTAPRVVPGLRIPGADRYLAAFAKARQAALSGAPAESALSDAAKSWEVISRDLGRERQLWHYRRSLNKLVTTAEPPARAEKPAAK